MHEANARPWRHDYLRYDAIRAQLEAWAAAHPKRARVASLGRTPEGRDILCLDLGPDPDRIRPAMVVSANIHATELAGSSVALAFAESVLGIHGGGPGPDGMPKPIAEALRDVRVFVIPRISPDGAESVLTDGAYVRSVPRAPDHGRQAPRWIRSDMTGDGRCRVMRVVDPSGQMVESPEVAGLLLPRRIDDPPPYYTVYPEGYIEHFDGTVPDPAVDTRVDLNRNFPWSWKPEPDQGGAGDWPGSAPESRALLEFAAAHPEIFAWVDFHTYGGVAIRPDGMQPDRKMKAFDLAVFRQLGEWVEAETGYPMVSGFEEFTYRPDVPIHGDLIEYAYSQRGAFAYVVELHDLFARLGVERKKPFIDHYRFSRDQMVALARWDAEHNAGRIMRPWVPFEHPQLGPVEVGGVDVVIGIRNPPPDQLPGLCDAQIRPLLRLGAIGPRPVLDAPEVRDLGDGLRAIEITVRNAGYLPTYVTEVARDRPHNEPLWAEVDAETVGPRRIEVGHLRGWGRGLDGAGALTWIEGRGHGDRRRLRWVVSGAGPVTVRAGSRRVGWVERRVGEAP